jgi:hypothetical protein
MTGHPGDCLDWLADHEAAAGSADRERSHHSQACRRTQGAPTSPRSYTSSPARPLRRGEK